MAVLRCGSCVLSWRESGVELCEEKLTYVMNLRNDGDLTREEEHTYRSDRGSSRGLSRREWPFFWSTRKGILS